MFNNVCEQCGRLFFLRLRLPFFCLLLSLAPLSAISFLFQEKNKTERIEQEFFTARKKAKTAFEKKERKDRFLARHAHSNPYFLDREIESFSPLMEEREFLKTWISHPVSPNKHAMLKRLKFLESKENQLRFAEEETQTSKLYKETIEKQRHSIELNQEDLKHLLCLIEDRPSKNIAPKTERPQILIRDFSLSKKITPLQAEVFEMQMTLLKREFKST